MSWAYNMEIMLNAKKLLKIVDRTKLMLDAKMQLKDHKTWCFDNKQAQM